MQPFLIAPFSTGLDTDAEPWLLPQDAFEDIVNAHIHNGILEKRDGYQVLGKLPHCISITNATIADPAVFTVASTTGLTNGDTVQLNYMSGGTWNSLNDTQYTVANLTGTTFTLQTLAGADVDGTSLGTFTSGCLGYYPGDRIMGIWRYVDSDNVKQLLIFDTQRAAIYNTVSELFDPLDTADVMAGGQTDYVVATNWASTASTAASPLYRLYFTNGVTNGGGATDGIRIYDPSISTTATTQFAPTINSGNAIRGCKLLFAFRGRLLLLHTFEGATTYPQRARWCQLQNPGTPGAFTDEWDDNVSGRGGYVDAPTGQQIISAQFIQDQLIVFFTESVWTLRPNPDPALPFVWAKINDFRACDGRMTTAGFDRYVTAIGLRGITQTDAVESRRWDARIEDFVQDDINANAFEKVFSKRSFGKRRLWTLYPSGDSADADAALIYDDESGAFSKYNIEMNVLGYGGVAKDFALDDFTAANAANLGLPETLSEAGDDELNDYIWQAGGEIFLGGDRSGQIHTLEVDASDAGTSISMELYSAAWNPWIKEGAQCRFGFLDLFVDTNQNTDVIYEFYKNNDQTPYVVRQGNFLPNMVELAEIGNITVANPGVISASQHGLSTGDIIYIHAVKGMQEINGGPYTVTVVDANNITIGVDTSTFTAYTGYGVITKQPFERTKTWKRVYAGGTGYQHRVRIIATGIDEPMRVHAFMPHFAKSGHRVI